MADESSESLHDPNSFILTDIPWLLVRADSDGHLAPGQVLTITGAGRRVLPLYTDEDLAERGMEDVREKGIEADMQQPESVEALALLMVQLRATGVTHVAFDPGPGRIHPRPIEAVIKAFCAKPPNA